MVFAVLCCAGKQDRVPGGPGQPFVALRAGPGPGPKNFILMMLLNSFRCENDYFSGPDGSV